MPTTKAAGVFFLTPDGSTLFLRRGPGGDFPGHWGFPGGRIEDGETAIRAAIRETAEEAGVDIAEKDLTLWTRTVTPTDSPGAEDVDFSTYLFRLPEPFDPKLSEESTGYIWAPITSPPDPVHPGCQIAFDRLGMDELGVAEAMAEGKLTSPQQYENMWLFNIRITGTGQSYRSGTKERPLDEHVWRDSSIYLNDRFVKRCSGLPVIYEHPKRATLDSKEFADRVVGTIMLPYVSGDEVWGISRIYDDGAIREMASGRIKSTSPAVVFRGPVNSKVELEDGSHLLIEGKPALLDHVAICPAGVWDKRGSPSGVSVHDAIGETYLTEEEKADAARKDAEEKEKAERDDRAKADAARQDMDKKIMDGIGAVMEKCDALGKRMDSMEAGTKRKDGEDESEEDKAKRLAADKAKADAEEEAKKKEEEEKADKAKADAAKKDEEEAKAREDAAKADSVILARLEDVEKAIPRRRPDEEHRALIAAQAKADEVFEVFGDAAPRPMDGETPDGYRVRIAEKLQKNSPTYKDANLRAIVGMTAIFDAAEQAIYADSVKVAMDPTTIAPDTLRPRKSTGLGGHTIITYDGDPRAWMDPMAAGARQLVTSIGVPGGN